ncbi:hypothetical protein [Methylomonas sp. MgM2]
MRRKMLSALSLQRLRWGPGVFFLALAVPATALIYHALDQLK